MKNMSGMNKSTPPAKTTLNLAAREKSALDLIKTVSIVLLVLVLAAAFAKFAVFDRYDALDEAELKLSRARAELNGLLAACTDYDEVQAQYDRYTYSGFDRTVPDRQEVLELLERQVFPVSGMQRLSVSDKTVSMTLNGMTLEEISRLIASLETEPLTESVVVSTAGYSENNDYMPTANITVTLADAAAPEGGGEGE